MSLLRVLRQASTGQAKSHKDFSAATFEQARQLCLNETLGRLKFLSVFFTFGYALFGVESYLYLSHFDANVTLFANIWPRLLYCSLPLAIQSALIFRSKLNPYRKIALWYALFSCVMSISGLIHIWPLALNLNAQVLTFVNAANAYSLIVLVAICAGDLKANAIIGLMIGVFFFGPLFFVAHLSGDRVVMNVIMHDSFFSLASGCLLGLLGNRLRLRVALLEIDRALKTEKFLGKTVSRAIFENREDLLERRTKKGFILALDIRGYTQMIQSNDAQKVGYFLNTYQAMVSDLVGQYGGFIHKTMGDGHLISFGLMDDDDVDLSDIPGIETELKQADDRRAQRALKRTILVMDLIAFNTELLAAEMGIPGIRLGAGLEHGDVELRVFGDSEYRREFDIFGNTIVRATRLQAHTKALLPQAPAGSSLLIASPIAMHYATAELRNRLTETLTDGLPVRDCTDLHSVWLRTYAPAIPAGLDLFPARDRNYTDESLKDVA